MDKQKIEWMTRVVESKFSDVQSYDKQNGYVFFPRNRLDEKGYANSTEILTHFCLINNSIPKDNQTFITNPLSISIIAMQSNLVGANKSRKMKKISGSLKRLSNDGVIKIKWFGKEWDNNSMFIAIQKRKDKENLIPVKSDVWYKIFFNNNYSDLERENCLSVFISFSSMLVLINKPKEVYQRGYSSFFEMKKAIGWETLENIGDRINISRKKVSEYMDKLVDIKVLSYLRVKFNNLSYSSTMYSRYEDRYVLKSFASLCIEDNLPNSKDYGDYSYLRISDVYE